MMAAPLIRSLDLLPGETPASYVARLAAHHGTIPREFCSDFGMSWPFLCSGHDDQLRRLSRLTGAELARLQFWSPVKLKNGRYRVGGTVSSVGAFRRTSLRLCPVCTMEALEGPGQHAVFQLLEWCVTCLHRCEKHGAALCALPPAANSHEAYDVILQVMRHRVRIADAAAHPVRLTASPFEAYVRQRIHRGPQEDWLKPLEMAHLHRACLTLGLTISGYQERRLIDVDRGTERHACETGFAVLAGGASALEVAFDQFRSRDRSGRAYFSADLGHFHAWLRTVQDEPALHDLTAVVRRYVFRNYPAKPDRPVLGALPEQITRITFDDARSRAKLGVRYLQRLLAHVDGVPLEDVMARTGITSEDLERVLAFWDSLCNLKDAAEALGIRPEQVKALIHSGVLSHLRFGSALRYPRREEIAGLLHAIEALPPTAPFSGELPLKTFCVTRSIGIAQIVAAWHSGQLDGQISRGEGKGLQALHIHPDAFCSKTAPRLEYDPSLAETAAYLKISLTGIRKLRDTGMLKQVRKRSADTNFRQSYITRNSIRAFERDHVTLGQLAERNGVAAMHLARRLDREGIPTLDGDHGMVRVYCQDILPTNLLRGVTRSDAPTAL